MKNLLTSESTNLPLPLIIIGAAILFVIICAVVVIIVLSARKNKKKKVINKSGDWLMALGGKENIKEVTAIGSRLSLNLNDKENIDREKLKELGVSSILVMSNKVTLVIEDKAEQVATSIQKEL